MSDIAISMVDEQGELLSKTSPWFDAVPRIGEVVKLSRHDKPRTVKMVQWTVSNFDCHLITLYLGPEWSKSYEEDPNGDMWRIK